LPRLSALSAPSAVKTPCHGFFTSLAPLNRVKGLSV
jgi:hypothetical protein